MYSKRRARPLFLSYSKAEGRTEIKAMAFDFDGTIVDSLDYLARGWERIAEELNMELTMDLRNLVGLTAEQIAHEISSGNPFLKERILKKRSEVFDAKRFANNVKLFPETEGVLKELRRRGFALALASSTVAARLVELADLYGISELFDLIIGGDEVPRSKPAPDLLLKAAKRFLIEPRTLAYIGDTSYDIEASLAAGSIAILVNRKGSRYDGPPPDFVISHMGELLLLV